MTSWVMVCIGSEISKAKERMAASLKWKYYKHDNLNLQI